MMVQQAWWTGLVVALAGVSTAALAQVAAVPSPAPTTPAAEEADRSLLSGEIVVTAQKRSQNVQNVGIAVTAYSGDQLRELGVREATDISTVTPGVHISGNLAGQNTQLTIRGVTQNDYNDIVEAPNAAYLDEGYIAVAQGQTFALFDLERVEVLKGPQGTLFGRNATGGLIHYISNKPSLTETKGFVDLSYSIFDSPDNPGGFRGEAALSVPLSSKFAARAAILWNQRDPILRNRYPAGAVGGSPGPGAGASLGDDDTLAGRLTLLAQPTDRFRALLSFNGARSRLATGAYQNKPTIGVFNAGGELIDVRNVAPGETRASIGANGQDFGSDQGNTGSFGAPFGRPVPGGDFFGYIDPDGKDFLTSSDFAFKNQGHVRTLGVNLDATYDLTDKVQLTYIGDYKKFDKLLFIDVDAGPGNQAANYAAVDAYTVTQELRLSGKSRDFDWVAGLYYLHIDTMSQNGLKFPVGSVVPGAPFDVASDAHLKTDSYSAFGQAEWRFAPRFAFIAGARVIQEQKDYVFSQGLYFTQDSRQIEVGTPVPIGPVFTATGAVPFRNTRGETLWAGKLQLEFHPVDKLLLYAGVNRGVKAGSYNAQLAGGLPAPVSFIPYKAEVLLSYETGFKYTFPGGHTRFNAAGYYYDYSNYQSFLFTGVSGYVINADARTYGGEATLSTSPIRGLDFSASVSAFDAKVKNVPLRIGGPIIRDVKPTYAPEFQTNFIARYQWAGLGGTLAIQGDAQTSSSFYYNLRNFSADRYDAYVTANAGLSWTDPRNALRLGFEVRNLTDERVGIQGFDLAGLCGCNEVSYKPPRAYQLSARYSF